MADPSPNVTSQNGGTQSGNRAESNAAITQEQLKAIADRVYEMLLRDLKHERERDRSSVWSSGALKRG